MAGGLSRSIGSGARPIRASWPSATRPASRCWPTRRPTKGKIAVEAILGKPAAFEPKAIPAVVFTDPEIAWAGLTETEAKRQGRAVEVAQFPWMASGRAQAIGRTEGLTKWIIDPQTQSVVGCGIVGSGAGDLISEAVLAIEMGCSVRDVAETIHPHPTLSETLGAAAEVHLGLATDIYRPKRARSDPPPSAQKANSPQRTRRTRERTVSLRLCVLCVLRGESCCSSIVVFSRGLVPAPGADPLLHVGLQHAEGGFVPLDRQLQGVQHALRRVEVRDDPLRHRNRMRRHSERLRIQTEIDDQFFRRARDAAEVGVKSHHLGIVDFHLHPLWGLRRSLRRGLAGSSPTRGGCRLRACLMSWPRNTPLNSEKLSLSSKKQHAQL